MSPAEPAASPRLRIRRSAAVTVAAFVSWLTAGPLALALIAERPLWGWLSVALGLVLLVAPVAVSLWAWRSGLDVTRRGITVRGLLSKRSIEWEHIEGFTTGADGVAAILDDRSQVPLKPLRAENLPKLLEFGGQELRDGAGRPASAP
ncbi:PH domain-containing protein [Glycomyces xiaoerkulensis]|uniref:PH domain-containing protein n=1 Tax=Glycomyces xiaoerkulensis TaxID=2038139 RepID=UPI0013001596|nr:PH domain-containing protein [Glycomyces xiaoerkulensis]